MTTKTPTGPAVGELEQVLKHCPKCATADTDPVAVAQAAFVAGLVHATLRQGGWTILEADPSAGPFTVGCASVFEPGVVADVTVTVRQMKPPA